MQLIVIHCRPSSAFPVGFVSIKMGWKSMGTDYIHSLHMMTEKNDTHDGGGTGDSKWVIGK